MNGGADALLMGWGARLWCDFLFIFMVVNMTSVADVQNGKYVKLGNDRVS